ncbi:unnamed protein product [Discosporangium mesarthrocarpum]
MAERMGGVYMANLTMNTTHLVAEATGTGTAKYKFATKMKDIVIVRPQWLLDCCQSGKRLQCEDYSIPPFAGLCITITGFSQGRREDLKNLITEAGGEYMGVMEAWRTTHLVAEVASGAKYEAAMDPAWGSTVRVVHSSWVEESLRQKCRLPEEDFPVDAKHQVVRAGAGATGMEGRDGGESRSACKGGGESGGETSDVNNSGISDKIGIAEVLDRTGQDSILCS